MGDGTEVPLITFWGTELLKDDELRIRLPNLSQKKQLMC